MIRVSQSADIPVELLGSWTTMIGTCQDEASKLYNGVPVPCGRGGGGRMLWVFLWASSPTCY